MTDTELEKLWNLRVAERRFSEGVGAVREIRLQGKTGDARVTFPQLL